jgi:2-hydroxy-3-keto-5-methylthiopentenyl-1-phosphate phosphatase
VLPVGSVVIDFDGTACAHDVAADLLDRFGPAGWIELDDATERGEIADRECLQREAEMLTHPTEELAAFAGEHCPLDPTFAPFVRWLQGEGVYVAIASDGFGFYIEPILRAAGLAHLPVFTNTWTGAGLRFDRGHPTCVGCGTCKIEAVFAARVDGPVAYVGEGSSDRFAALYADVAFAKDRLVDLATADGVPFVPWTSFDDVRARLETSEPLPGPVAPDRCPGWTVG